MRLVLALRRKRRVRIHMHRPEAPSVEGILAGRWGGHYVVLAAKVLEAEDRSIALDGHLEIPRENVLFVQVI